VTSIGYCLFEIFNDGCSITLTCLGLTPPTLTPLYVLDSKSRVFDGRPDYEIYVPAEALDSYKSSWSEYASKIKPIPTE
jgi:hypothetical protein